MIRIIHHAFRRVCTASLNSKCSPKEWKPSKWTATAWLNHTHISALVLQLYYVSDCAKYALTSSFKCTMYVTCRVTRYLTTPTPAPSVYLQCRLLSPELTPRDRKRPLFWSTEELRLVHTMTWHLSWLLLPSHCALTWKQPARITVNDLFTHTTSENLGTKTKRSVHVSRVHERERKVEGVSMRPVQSWIKARIL